MNRVVRHATLALFLTLGAVTEAAATAEAAPDRAQQLFRLSGMDRQLGSLAATLAQELEAQSAQIPEPTRGALLRAVRDAYDPAPLRNVALAHLRPRLTTGPVDAVVQWLASERGRRITQLEELASTPEGQAKLRAFAATQNSHPPKPERLALIQRLDAASRATEIATNVTLRIAASVARGLLATSPASTPTPDIDAILEAQRGQIRAGIQTTTLVGFLYTYRELSDADLFAYVAFIESAPGQWYNDAMASAFVASLDFAATRLSTNLATTVRPQLPANAR